MAAEQQPYVLPPRVMAMVDAAVAAAPPLSPAQECALRRAFAPAVEQLRAEALAAAMAAA